MFDESTYLRETDDLQRLLGHYVSAAEPDPEAWQERPLAFEGLAPDALVPLHGHLLAHGWLAINTSGRTGGYRVTPAGVRALKRATHDAGDDDAEETPAWQERLGKRKKPRAA